jgi:MSHA biogenesis protein MshL
MRRLTLIAAAMMLTGCEAPRIQPAAVQHTIDTTLSEAATPRARAAAPDAVSEALLPPLTIQMPGATVPVEARFDLVVNNAPAQQVFMALVSGTRYSMLVHPDVKEGLSINLKEVTLTEALEAIREVYGYEYRIQGTRIYVEPVSMQTRLFHVNYLAGRRSGRADVRVSSGSIQASSSAPGTQPGAPLSPTTVLTPGGGIQQSTDSSRVTTSSDNDFWGDIQNAIRTIIGTEGGRSAVVNSNAGVIMVRAMPKELRAVDQYLKAMSLVVERQVMLEAKIIEVTLTDQFSSGINWAAFRHGGTRVAGGVISPSTTLRTQGSIANPNVLIDPSAPIPVSPDPLTGLAGSVGAVGARLAGAASLPGAIFGLAFQTGSFAALLNFLESQGTVHVLSSPRIATLNNQKAVIKVGTDEFFVTNVTTTTTATGTTTTVSPTITTQPFFSGIALDVTPQISGDDQITLHIHPSVSVVTDKTKIVNLGTLGIFTLPLASSNINESDTIVRVQDGTIAAIGGLMRQQQNNTRFGLPGTTDSAAGALTGTRDQGLSKSELVILLKVTVIRGDAAWQQQAQELNDRMLNLRRPVQDQP